MEKHILKETLKEIAADDYRLPEGKSVQDYLPYMLAFIGDLDPELRDDLIYSTMANWIAYKGYLSNDEMLSLLETIIGRDYLLKGLNSQDETLVFTRTFSALILPPILYVHLEKPFLNDKVLLKLHEALLKYMISEWDLRGYDQTNGWAHGMAHASDAVNMLIQTNIADESLIMSYFNVFKDRMIEGQSVYSANEDERMITCVQTAIENGYVPEDVLMSWFETFVDAMTIEDFIVKYWAKINAKSFIRGLYFRLLNQCPKENLLKSLIAVEKKLNNYIKD